MQSHQISPIKNVTKPIYDYYPLNYLKPGSIPLHLGWKISNKESLSFNQSLLIHRLCRYICRCSSKRPHKPKLTDIHVYMHVQNLFAYPRTYMHKRVLDPVRGALSKGESVNVHPRESENLGLPVVARARDTTTFVDCVEAGGKRPARGGI